MSDDRPLSGPQEIALAKLASATDATARRVDRGEDEGSDWDWVAAWHVGRTNTVDSLERLGLVEQRLMGHYRMLYEVRLTEAGREMCDSMGD